MTADDLIIIETALDIQLREAYRAAVTSADLILPQEMFTDVQTIIGTNLGYQRNSWLGRPLDRVFFVFGRDRNGNALFMDLDIIEPIIFSADHSRKCGKVEARSFDEWFSRHAHVA